jgi:branched-chain amino acid transport system ATP-binding protein
MTAVLSTSGLTKRFGGIIATDSVTFTLQKGARHALIGPNGAGKTTFINLITGVLSPTAGTMTPLETLSVALAEKAGVGQAWWKAARGRAALDGEAAKLAALFRLEDVLESPVATLPYGRQRLLEIAIAVACGPSVLLLDEPAAGVPEAERAEVLGAIDALPKDVTVLLIEHDMGMVFRFAETISVLVNGALFAEGPAADIAKDPRVRAVYLGESFDG